MKRTLFWIIRKRLCVRDGLKTDRPKTQHSTHTRKGDNACACVYVCYKLWCCRVLLVVGTFSTKWYSIRSFIRSFVRLLTHSFIRLLLCRFLSSPHLNLYNNNNKIRVCVPVFSSLSPSFGVLLLCVCVCLCAFCMILAFVFFESPICYLKCCIYIQIHSVWIFAVAFTRIKI